MARGDAARTDHVDGVLHLYHRPLRFSDATTVMEHVESLQLYSGFPVWNVNTELGLPIGLVGMSFSAVVLHYSVFSAGQYRLDTGLRRYLSEECESSFKVAFFQDEHHFCRDRFAFLNEYGIDCVYSCMESPYMEQVYRRYTDVRLLVSNVPGYVSQDTIEAAERFALPAEERHLDIAYRGRALPPYCGRGGLEKYEIGIRFLELGKDLGLDLDIACDEASRIYGDDWYRFTGSARAVLGTESGVSVVDLEDEVYAQYQELLALGEVPTIGRLEEGALGRWDGNIPYRTISPRHFEAAAFNTCQILYDGSYSGAMQPMVHYIPLRKDFSNFEEVIERFRNADLRRELAANARRDLIDSGEWGYEPFVAGFDEALRNAGLSPGEPGRDGEIVEAALRKGRTRRIARGRLKYLHDNEFPGRQLVRPVARPLLRGAKRVRRRVLAARAERNARRP